MRAIIQRVKWVKLNIDSNLYSEINNGLLVFLGVSEDDNITDLNYIKNKIVGLRIFEDSNDKMNLSVKDVKGEVMVVSQFTLFGDARKGNRPNFMRAAKQEKAEKIYNQFVEEIKKDIDIVKTGVFGADMKIELLNDGPVTIQLDSEKLY
ncbi:D-aminoacyl-tRNA deacylase [Helcococcus ovis]|uniref:D-aminoacyl-tRNA deacylase n=2 Tax=Helcococcus ovis TaxID=72026 RepID=A0A4R9C092_9FIRM|nr:D-aminoacyl-tRNA deacylase [Helcococcus ovis]TFF64463.1 D-tyrosyl-tRNA(Tyr) deacylase [Helcococcus ovis]TFF64689.1 D-tyrosyl-tRNA(Tyr) deacylase [Helcococcus ovis]TFF68109.1 D-tyrosyl-tRNA(Tyr) deacylase [Helcococcus ovis]WNZ01966.1 D-aminoacyl-tRNA deacylase [Helcococcus ovis]